MINQLYVHTQIFVLSPFGEASREGLLQVSFLGLELSAHFLTGVQAVPLPPLLHLRWICGSVHTSAVGGCRNLGRMGLSDRCSRKSDRNKTNTASPFSIRSAGQGGPEHLGLIFLPSNGPVCYEFVQSLSDGFYLLGPHTTMPGL